MNIVGHTNNEYTIFLDESNNCVKFRFKDTQGNVNAKWYNDFTLAGIAIEGELDDAWLNDLFDSLQLKKNQELKLGAIAKFNGEDSCRLLDILKSEKLEEVLSRLTKKSGLYIHWDTENLLYFSLADIVDSAFNNLPEHEFILKYCPKLFDIEKSALYLCALKEPFSISAILAAFDYPNVKPYQFKDFIEALITWLSELELSSEIQSYIDWLTRALRFSQEKNDLLFLQDNTDRLLIEDFVANYALRIVTFPRSILHFDQCSLIEENIENDLNVYKEMGGIPGKYDFVNSKENKWVQLSDVVAGICGALMAYINTHDEIKIKNDYDGFSDIQKNNLSMLIGLRQTSVQKELYFDHCSRNLIQIKRLRYLNKLCGY